MKLMRAPSTRRKQTIKRKPGAGATPAAGDIQEEDSVAAAADDGGPAMDGIKCVAGEFQSALDTLFNTLDDAHAWYVFCVNPNDSRLPNQLEDRGVKAQVRSLGLSQMTRKQGVVFEAGMSPQEFCDRYRDYGVASDGDPVARVSATREALELHELDIVIGQFKV